MPNTDYAVVVRMAEEVPSRILNLIVTDQVSRDKACSVLRDITTIRKGIIEHHAEVKKATYDAWQSAIATESRMLKPVQIAERFVSNAIGSFDTHMRREQERTAQAAREKAVADAHEKRRLEIAEAARIAREEVAQMIENAPDEATAQAILDQASEAVQGAMAEVVAEPLRVEEYRVPEVVRKSVGVASLVKYCCEVTSVKDLCLAVGNGDAPVEYVMGLEKDKITGVISSSALNRVAGTLGKGFKVAGCGTIEGTTVRSRGR